LFTSVGTLLCCALPALLVALGMGAVVAGVVSTIPALVWLSLHKLWVFAVAGVFLLAAASMQWHSRNAPCPIDAAQRNACLRLRRFSKATLGLAIALYLIAAFMAFGIGYVV
jgi:hypothetical protein